LSKNESQTKMKTCFCNKFFLCAATLALEILGDTTAQAQLGGVPLWANSSLGSGAAIAVDGSGNVFVTGNSYDGGVNSYDYTTVKYSGAGVPLWGGGIEYNGPGSNYDFAGAVAVDGSGNVFVTGASSGATNGYPNNNYDYATIKYSGAGAPLWTNRYNGPGNGDDQATALAVDSGGNVFVTGFSTGIGGDFDYATIKYSSAGTALWTNRYDGPGNTNDAASAVAVDGNGNVFVTGYSTGTGGGQDYATIKYSGAGVPLWTNRYSSNDRATAVALDGSGNVFVTGPAATIKYSAAGVLLWTNRYGDPGNGLGQANAIAVDAGGNLLVTGESALDADGYYHWATTKYSGAGVPLWTNLYKGPTSDDNPVAIAVDGSDNVFVTGYSYSGYSFETAGYVTVGYSGAGVALWTNRYDWNQFYNQDNIARAVAVDSSGNVFVTGDFWDVINQYQESLTIKYSSAIPPSLSIALTTSNMVAVSWPMPSLGFTLQQNTNGLATVNWSNVVTTPLDDGTTKTVIVDPPTGNRFYRLVHP
jgi:hypothetical protein